MRMEKKLKSLFEHTWPMARSWKEGNLSDQIEKLSSFSFSFSLDFYETKRRQMISFELFFSQLTRTKLKQFYSQLLLNLNKQRKIMLNQDVELETLLVDKDNRKTFCSTWLFSINERKNNNQMADGYRRKSSRCFWWSESESMKNWVLSTCQNDGIDWIKRFNRSTNDQIVTSISRKSNNLQNEF